GTAIFVAEDARIVRLILHREHLLLCDRWHKNTTHKGQHGDRKFTHRVFTSAQVCFSGNDELCRNNYPVTSVIPHDRANWGVLNHDSCEVAANFLLIVLKPL